MHNLRLNLLTDSELMGLVLKHNHRAFRELVVRYSGDLFFLAYSFVRDVKKSEKIVEEIFIEIWRKPYLYGKNFKIEIHRRLLKKLRVRNKKMVATSLYYFSTLNPDEICEVDGGVDIKNIEPPQEIEMPQFKHQGEILRLATSHRQTDRHQTMVIILSIIPVLVLVFLVVYSLMRSGAGIK